MRTQEALSTANVPPARRGNAIVMVLGILTLAAALIAASATSSVSSLSQTAQRNRDVQAMAAVEAVLNHHEAIIAKMAADEKLLTWLEGTGTSPNFGVDIFGGC